MSGAPEPTLFDLSSRTKLHISGADALRFLNGQLTNDVRKATAANAIEAAVLNAKGKMDAHVFIRAVDDGFLIDAGQEVRESLAARLNRYVIADDVTIEDVTDRWALFHTLPGGEESYEHLSALRFGTAGNDFWVDSKKAEIIRNDLKQRFVAISEDQTEVYRIEQGVPRWGSELTNDIIPLEANLEDRAIDFAKGCYIGQEVISRMKMSGQTNKRLCGLVAKTPGALKAGSHLRAEGGDKQVGWITSATRSSHLNAEIGLGFVKRGFNEKGTRLVSGTADETVELVELPFV